MERQPDRAEKGRERPIQIICNSGATMTIPAVRGYDTPRKQQCFMARRLKKRLYTGF